MKRNIGAGSALALVLASAAVAGPETVDAQTPADTIDPAAPFRMRQVSQVRLSPDGRRVAFRVRALPPDGGLERFRHHLRIADLDGGASRAVTSKEHSARNPRWSPDGSRLAYISDESGTQEIWVMPADGGSAERLTEASTGVRAFAWSPDGRAIAFVMADAREPEDAERRKLVRLASDEAPAARLRLLPVDSPDDVRTLTEPPLHVMGAPSWAPDGSKIAFSHRPGSSRDAFGQGATSVLDLETGERARLRFAGALATTPAFSPDGSWVAVRASSEPTDGPGPGGLYVVSADGSTERFLASADHRAQISGWSRDGGRVVVMSQVGTETHVRRLPLDGSDPETLYRGPLVVSGLHMDAAGSTAAFVAQSLDTPPEVYAATTTDFEPRAVTKVNADLSLAPFGRTDLLTWTSTDGATIEGLLTHPAGSPDGERVPLLVVAHAGGEAFSQSYVANPLPGSSRAFPPAVFSSRGYAVLRVNQRGGGLPAYGFDAGLPVFRPEERANPDVLTGVNRVVAMGLADPRRLAVMGWSNGGLVTASLITNTDRFAAASMMAGFPYLALAAGTNAWMGPDLGGEPWEDLRAYVEHAPSFALDRVRTPTLILQGETDTGVPVAQARALHGSLQKLGVATELAIYQDMGHGPSKPSQMIDIVRRNLAWFDRHLREK